MDHYDDHHDHGDSGFSGGSTDHAGDWHHDQQYAMAGDDHDLHSRHGGDDGFGDSHHHSHDWDDQDDQDHPAGCPCCCDTAAGHDEPHEGDAGGSGHSGSDGDGDAQNGQVGSVGGDHPWSHTLGALHTPDQGATATTATSSPQPAASSGSLVPSAPLPSTPPDNSEHGDSPDIVTITDNNPVFAKLLAEYGNDPAATPENIPNLLSQMPPAAAAEVGSLVDHLQATKEAGVDTWVLPDGVSADVPFDGTAVDYLAADGSPHPSIGAAEDHNRLG